MLEESLTGESQLKNWNKLASIPFYVDNDVIQPAIFCVVMDDDVVISSRIGKDDIVTEVQCKK